MLATRTNISWCVQPLRTAHTRTHQLRRTENTLIVLATAQHNWYAEYERYQAKQLDLCKLHHFRFNMQYDESSCVFIRGNLLPGQPANSPSPRIIRLAYFTNGFSSVITDRGLFKRAEGQMKWPYRRCQGEWWISNSHVSVSDCDVVVTRDRASGLMSRPLGRAAHRND